MSHSDNVLRALCHAAGIDDCRSVLQERHLVIDDCVVGLIDDGCGERRDSLLIYIELDALAAARDLELPTRLLHSNVHRPMGLSGWFGVHADTQRVVYCFQIHSVAQMDGGALAALLREQVHAAQVFVRRLMH